MKQRKDSAEQYKQAGRLDLESNEIYEISFINTFLPRKATVEDIHNAICNLCAGKGWVNDEDNFIIPKKVYGNSY